MSKPLKIYIWILILTAMGMGFTNNIISNFFKDAYDVTAFQRGIIEFPREFPGLITVIVIASLSFINDIKISIIAQFLSAIGILVLGLTTPPFAVMLIFVWVNSMGMHLFFPLQDSIGLSLVDSAQMGKKLGQFKGLFTGVQMLAAMLVYLGFKSGFMRFDTQLKSSFIIAGFLFIGVLFLLIALDKMVDMRPSREHHNGYVFRKAYKYYYWLVVLYGVQKQIMMVYGPWVLIELLNKKADTLSILTVIGSFIGIFFIPAVGKWMDQFGVKRLLYADALSFVVVYFVYGILCSGYIDGWIAKSGMGLMLAYGIFIIDRMSTQMGLVRTVYLRKIAVKPSDITPTLSFGQSLDHLISIVMAVLGGIVWVRYGPQYIFYGTALLSLGNLYIAYRVKEPSTEEDC